MNLSVTTRARLTAAGWLMLGSLIGGCTNDTAADANTAAQSVPTATDTMAEPPPAPVPEPEVATPTSAPEPIRLGLGETELVPEFNPEDCGGPVGADLVSVELVGEFPAPPAGLPVFTLDTTIEDARMLIWRLKLNVIPDDTLPAGTQQNLCYGGSVWIWQGSPNQFTPGNQITLINAMSGTAVFSPDEEIDFASGGDDLWSFRPGTLCTNPIEGGNIFYRADIVDNEVPLNEINLQLSRCATSSEIGFTFNAGELANQ